MEIIVNSNSFEESLRQTVEFNTYRPAEVSEWFPLDKLLPSDVEDEGDTLEYYREKYANDLVDWYRKTVRHGKEIQIRPESLPRLDYCLWAYLIHSKDNSDLIPYVGAFLGEVIVDFLEGEWEPRKNIEEAQVVVGDRVWLPFLRAKHCLQSKDAVLDYSLTKFYRTVERYVKGEQA